MNQANQDVQVIVAAEEVVYDFLDMTGIGWDLQTRAESVDHLWEAMESDPPTISNHSKVAFVSANLPQDGQTKLVDTIATIAGNMPTFLIAWDEANLATTLAEIRQASTQLGQGTLNLHVLRASDPVNGLADVRSATQNILTWPAQLPDLPRDSLIRDGQATQAAAPDGTATPQAGPQLTRPIQGAAEAHTEPLEAAVATITQEAPAGPPAPAGAPGAPTYPVAQNGVPLDAPQETSEADLDVHLPSEGQHTISVTSSKGGAGKTTSALCLAGQIAESSRKAYEQGIVAQPLKVVVVDMDIHDGQVGTALGHHAPTAMNIRVAPSWDEETILKYLIYSDNLGIDLLLAPTRVRAATDLTPDFYRQVIRHLQRTHDVVILDTSVRYTDPLISDVCYKESSSIVFVTTLVQTAVIGMARAIKEIIDPVESGGLGIKKSKIGILVNQSVRDVGLTMDEVFRGGLERPIIGAIPLASWDVQYATNHANLGMLLKHPKLGRAYYKLAKAVIPKSGDENSRWYLAPILS